MLKKYCEYCGCKTSTSASSDEEEDLDEDSSSIKEASIEEDTDLTSFLKHFAALADDAEDEESEEEDDEMDKEASFDPTALKQITKQLDDISNVMEKSGNKKIAYRLDKVADLLDQVVSDKRR